jgi:hypothetical protein
VVKEGDPLFGRQTGLRDKVILDRHGDAAVKLFVVPQALDHELELLRHFFEGHLDLLARVGKDQHVDQFLVEVDVDPDAVFVHVVVSIELDV